MNTKIWLGPVLLVSLGVLAEEAPKITVNAAGSVKIVSTALEVSVTVKDKGDDPAGAMTALKASRDKIVAKLGELGFPAGEARDDAPTIVDKAQMEAMKKQMAMQSGGRLKKADKKDVEKPVVDVQQVVHARIPLKGKDATAVMLEAEEIKAKVAAAKLIEPKAEGEEEDSDEQRLRMQMMNRYNNDGQNEGPVGFVFVAPLTEELRTQALKDALKQAGDTAARTAKAMGRAGADVRSVTVQSDGGENDYRYDRYGRPMPSGNKSDALQSQTPEMMLMARIIVEYTIK